MPHFKKYMVYLLLLTSFLNLILAYKYRFSLDYYGYLPFFFTLIILLLITLYFYKMKRVKIAMLFDACLFYLLSGILLALYSYEMSALNYPLVDPIFVKIDSYMGFNWVKHTAFIQQYPWFYWFLELIYISYIFQMFPILYLLSRKHDQNHLFKVLFSFSLTAFICITISIFLPAWGAFFEEQNQLHDMDYVIKTFGNIHCDDNFMCDFLKLRDGTLRVLPFKLHGIMTFPSFHAAGATLFALYMLREKYFALPIAIYNGLIILSALSVGHHHLIDVIVGCLIAMAVYSVIFKERGAKNG